MHNYHNNAPEIKGKIKPATDTIQTVSPFVILWYTKNAFD